MTEVIKHASDDLLGMGRGDCAHYCQGSGVASAVIHNPDQDSFNFLSLERDRLFALRARSLRGDRGRSLLLADDMPRPEWKSCHMLKKSSWAELPT